MACHVGADGAFQNIDKPPFAYQGKTYTAYEATQKQRQIESTLRNIILRLIMENWAGLDDAAAADSIKYKRLYDEYENFSKAAGFPKQDNSEFVENFTGMDHKAAMKASTSVNSGLMHRKKSNSGVFTSLPESMTKNMWLFCSPGSGGCRGGGRYFTHQQCRRLRKNGKYPSVYDVCGLGDVAGLCGAKDSFKNIRLKCSENNIAHLSNNYLANPNCRHHYHAFVDGVSEPAYTQEELDHIDKPSFDYQGKTYSAYEATQKQRQIESALRNIKRRLISEKQSGLDGVYTADSIKYKRLYDEYEKFSDAAGLPKQYNRSFVDEFTGKNHKATVKVSKKSKIIVENSNGSGTMSTKQVKQLQQERETVAIPKQYDGDFSDYEPLDLTDAETSKLKEIHSLTSKNNAEHLFIESNGVFSDIHTDNLPNTVSIPDTNYLPGTKIFHSHTNVTLPSRKDFEQLLDENVSEIGVITENGDVYVVSKEYHEDISLDEFRSVIKDIVVDVDMDIQMNPEFLAWSPEEKVYMAIKEQTYRIAREFKWKLKGGRL